MEVWAWILMLGGLAGLAYVLLGYPLLLGAYARLFPRPHHPVPDAPLPRISICLACYNEERVLDAKLASLLAQDYPPELVEILVADDGSSDGTTAILRRYAEDPALNGRVRLFPPIGNTGKPTQVNRFVPTAKGDILVFTDARQPLEPGSLRALALALSDPSVGGATGEVVYRPSDGSPVLVSGYWRYETQIRVWQSAVHSCTSGAGPLMCCRRELYRIMPKELVLDDILTPIRVVLQRRRFVYVPEAVAVETFVMNPKHEFRRRVRNSAGVIQAIRAEPRTLAPWADPVWFHFWSHKVGRLLLPLFLAAMLLGTLLGLGRHALFAWALVAELLFLGYAWVGWKTCGTRRSPPGAALALSFVMQVIVVTLGFVRELRGESTAAWGSREGGRRA